MNIKFPVSWLREYLKTDVANKTISSYLTACGPSVERVEKIGNDYIWDIEVTTNRPDTFSVFGIAREAHAILSSNKEVSTVTAPRGQDTNLDPDVSKHSPLRVQVLDSKLCPRFTAIVLEIKIAESPATIKNRLKASGIRPINNMVDITNYVMLETGQPMHAFDYDKITGSKMILRASREGEKITTLDGIKRNLPKGSIVIEDAKHLVDLCGIMGGENSQITRRTKKVIFFVQTYDPITIRKTTQALAFRTDASTRFEKGVDLENILPTLKRSVYLAKSIAGAKIISELVDIYPKKQISKTTRLSLEKLNKYLGIDLTVEKASSILKNLGFSVQTNATQITAITPSWRAKDIESDVDLIEEIARIYGYQNLPSKLPEGEMPQREDSILKDVIEIKKALKYLGLFDVITYSIISKNMLAQTGMEEKKAVELANPLTEEWQFMRPTIIPSLLDVLVRNQSLVSADEGMGMKIFEIAKTYDKQKKGLPIQDLKIAFALSSSNFLEIKGIVEALFKIVKREPKFTKFTEESTLVTKSQAAFVKTGNQAVGSFGMLKPQLANQLGLSANIAVAELNLTKIYEQPTELSNYQSIPKFPPVIEDISAIFSVHTPIEDIVTEIKKSSDLISGIEILDIFEDSRLGENKKSVTLTLKYQKTSATPTREEVNLERSKITKTLETTLRAKVRR